MDYSLAALKLLCVQLKDARESPSQNAVTLGGILFQRVWLQGVLVSPPDDDGRLLLDDGTGVVQIYLSGDFRIRQWNTGFFFNFSFLIFVQQNNYDTRILEFCERGWRRILANFGFRIAGMYVMVVGGFVIRTDDIPVIKVNSHISLHIFSINFGLKFDISFGSV